MTNYGSGVLGPWASLTHRTLGDWATAEFGFIGDSILTAVQPALSAKAAAEGLDIAVDCWSGRPFAPNPASPGKSASEWIKTQLVLPKKLVLCAGSNDIFDVPAFDAAMWEFVLWAETQGTQLFWIDTQVRRTAQTVAVQMADQMNSGWLNQSIHNVMGFDGGHVIPWSEFFCIDKNRPSRYLRDGLHPTDGTTSAYNGVAAWVNIVWAAIAPYIGPPPAAC